MHRRDINVNNRNQRVPALAAVRHPKSLPLTSAQEAGESRPGIGRPIACPRFYLETRGQRTRSVRFGKEIAGNQKKRVSECIVVIWTQQVPNSHCASIGRSIATLTDDDDFKKFADFGSRLTFGKFDLTKF